MSQRMKPQVPDMSAVFFISLKAFFPAVDLIVRLRKTEHMDKGSQTVQNLFSSGLFGEGNGCFDRLSSWSDRPKSV